MNSTASLPQKETKMNEPLVEIVLVEDNPNDVELIMHALKQNHVANKVKVIRDGEEAVNYLLGEGLAKGRRPKFILLDLKLPKISGLEVLKKIKSSQQTKYIPVVVLTSSREERDILDSYDLGANSYVTKPVDFEQFSYALNQIGYYWLSLNECPMD